MGKATNVTITQVEAKKSGKGKAGPWTIYDLVFDGSDTVYGYFSGKGHIIPVKGMKVASLDYAKEEKDGYDNYKVTNIVLAKDQPTPNPTPDAQNSGKEAFQGDSNGRAFIAHGECVIELMKLAGGANVDESQLLHLVDVFKAGIARMTGTIPAKKEIRNDNPPDKEPGWDGEDPGAEDSSIPF